MGRDTGYRPAIWLAVALVLLGRVPNVAAVDFRQQKLTASDGMAGDVFGGAVAVSADGQVALIGADRDNVAARADQGSAYVFRRDGTSWTQAQKLTASDGAAGDVFGYAVALGADGQVALVGAPGDDVAAMAGRGSAYLFVRGGTGWVEQQQLTASDGAAGDGFGSAVALSADGQTALIGAPADTVAGSVLAGSAYVFVQGASGWVEQQHLVGGGGELWEGFGHSVSLSAAGQVVLIGAPVWVPEGLPYLMGHGTAFVFVREAGTWVEGQILAASTPAREDQFGSSVSLDGSGQLALVGSRGWGGSAGTNQGAAFVFAKGAGGWVQEQQLDPTDAVAGGRFGWGVALSAEGRAALVGAAMGETFDGARPGYAYVFARGPSGWLQHRRLAAADGASGDRFGGSVALGGDGQTALSGRRATTCPGPKTRARPTCTRCQAHWSSPRPTSPPGPRRCRSPM